MIKAAPHNLRLSLCRHICLHLYPAFVTNFVSREVAPVSFHCRKIDGAAALPELCCIVLKRRAHEKQYSNGFW